MLHDVLIAVIGVALALGALVAVQALSRRNGELPLRGCGLGGGCAACRPTEQVRIGGKGDKLVDDSLAGEREYGRAGRG